MGKILFAGPFIGEFGMELFEWQGYIREMSKKFDKTIISSRPHHEFLYKDFCNEFVSFDPNTYDCDGYECLDKIEIPNLHEKYNFDKLIRILDLKSHTKELYGKSQKFKSYNNKKNNYNFDFCICARSFKRGAKTKLERNWDINNCKDVVNYIKNKGFSVASVGLKISSEFIEGTEDLRDIPLEKLSQVLSSSKAIIGPSSGVMHFASLCECPQIVWGENHLEERYKIKWNPFNVNVKYIANNNWNPSFNEICEEVDCLL